MEASAMHVTQLNVLHVFLDTIWLVLSVFTQLGFVGTDSGMSWQKNAMTATLIQTMDVTQIARSSKISYVYTQTSYSQEHHSANTTTQSVCNSHQCQSSQLLTLSTYISL